MIGEPPWGYAEVGEKPYSPPAPLLQDVRPEHYAVLERLMPPRRDAQPPIDPLRVAETVADPSLLGHLVGRARRGGREQRRLALFTVGWVAQHFGAVVAGTPPWPGAENGWPAGRPDADTALRVARDAAAALVDLSADESDLFLAGSALEHLTDLPTQVQLRGSRLPALMSARSWQVRHPALRAAHLCPVEEVEQVLLATAGGSDADAAASAAAQLRRCAPGKAVAVLVPLLDASSTDLRASALDSLVAMTGAEALPHVRDAAATWPFPARYAALGLLVDHGTADDVPLVAERVRRMVGRTRKLESVPSELTFLLPFLAEHGDRPEATKALDQVRRRWDALFDAERAWVAEHLPELVPEGAVVPPGRAGVTRLPRCPTDLDALLRKPSPRRWLRRRW